MAFSIEGLIPFVTVSLHITVLKARVSLLLFYSLLLHSPWARLIIHFASFCLNSIKNRAFSIEGQGLYVTVLDLFITEFSLGDIHNLSYFLHP